MQYSCRSSLCGEGIGCSIAVVLFCEGESKHLLTAHPIVCIVVGCTVCYSKRVASTVAL